MINELTKQTITSNPRILITGGLGFIGRNLSKALLGREYGVVVLDNLYRWNIADAEKSGLNLRKIKFMEGSICNKKQLRQAVKEVDIVIHLASISQVMTSIEQPDKCFEYNILGTKNIAELCGKYKKRLIFSSSREVYGKARYLPVDLKHPLFPENPYGASKVIGEHLIKSYSPKLQYTIFRLSNVYGLGDKGRVIPRFFQKANSGEDITIFGDKKIIDFIYIDDVINAFLDAIENGKGINKVLNIGSGTPTKLDELAEIILEITGSKSKIRKENAREGEIDQFTADISETSSELGWKPKVKLIDGLKNLGIEYSKLGNQTASE